MSPTGAEPRLETIAVHGGNHRADRATGAVAVPIYQTTSYQFRDAAFAARLFAMEEDGYAYTRLANPTHDALESRLARLEGGVAALLLASGQAARLFALLNLAAAGDNLVAAGPLAGRDRLSRSLARFGVALRFADPATPEQFARLSDQRTKAYFAPTLAWPQPTVLPIDKIAETGLARGIPLIVDNSRTPVLCRPLRHGAALVIHSSAGFLTGRDGSEGGLIVDGGEFPWAAHGGRFPELTGPDDSYHGAIWTEVAAPLGGIAFLLRVRARLLRDFGPAAAPFSAFQILQGIETVALRVRQQSANALTVAGFLAGHPLVRQVVYPGLGDGRRTADRLLSGGYGGLVGVTLTEGTVPSVLGRLRLIREGNAAGALRSQAQRISDRPIGEPDAEPHGLLLLSVGLEHPDDIIEDLRQALDGAP